MRRECLNMYLQIWQWISAESVTRSVVLWTSLKSHLREALTNCRHEITALALILRKTILPDKSEQRCTILLNSRLYLMACLKKNLETPARAGSESCATIGGSSH